MYELIRSNYTSVIKFLTIIDDNALEIFFKCCFYMLWLCYAYYCVQPKCVNIDALVLTILYSASLWVYVQNGNGKTEIRTNILGYRLKFA